MARPGIISEGYQRTFGNHFRGNSAVSDHNLTQATLNIPEVDQPNHTERASRKPRRQPPYRVVLWNDDDHSFHYVMHMLRQLFGFSLSDGFHLADEVHHRGWATLLTTTLEHAELKRDQIHTYGKDGSIQQCSGSMYATIESESAV